MRDAATLRATERFAVDGRRLARGPTAYALSPDDRTLAIGERRRLGALPRPPNGSRPLRLRPPRRRRHRRAVHPRRPLSDLHERGRRRDRVGRRAGARPARRCPGTGSGVYGAADHARRADARTPPAWTAPCSSGTCSGSRRLGRPVQGRRAVAATTSHGSSSDGRLLATGQDDGALSDRRRAHAEAARDLSQSADG